MKYRSRRAVSSGLSPVFFFMVTTTEGIGRFPINQLITSSQNWKGAANEQVLTGMF
jgi:hypothetical protein